uniref:CHY-type domain-containing protein n=1 Tax=Aureoumbra lagunensis TaxID=44058 RepID=A0A7S3JTZ2_9STRA|mmetsp:Transcript_13526/g.16949  ORF Transcript_13526/g.16949 Transcript_13526/m.16949 type:complete len:458 (+) Transcript_13526:153-1526(+)
MYSLRKNLLQTCPLVEITLLHRAMRLELMSMCNLANSGNEEDFEVLLSRIRDFDIVFTSHSAVEDDYLFQAIAPPSLVESADQEHIDETIMMRTAEAAVLDCCRETRNQDEKEKRIQKAKVCLCELKEKLSEHMLREEDSIFPCLAKFTEQKLKKLVADVLGSRPADVLETTLRMQFKHLDNDHAQHLIGTMLKVTKKTNFEQWLRYKTLNKNLAWEHYEAKNRRQQQKHQHQKITFKHLDNDPYCPSFGWRAAHLIAPCCQKPICCNRCHNESNECDTLDRTAIHSMICARCAFEQPLAAVCIACHSRVADYFCDVCRHLDSTGTPLYHCPYCNICREGHGLGIDYHHCMECNLCVLLEHKDTHYCVQSSCQRIACAICNLPFFHSREHVDLLPCDHPKHSACCGSCTICATNAAADAETLLRTTSNMKFSPSTPAIPLVAGGNKNKKPRLALATT